jgi:hypothetical protein
MMMKQYMKSVMTMALMLLFTSGAWAADVTIKKQLNGTATETGTATKSISEGVCTLTVTPPAGSYVTKDFITAYAVWNGNMAQTPRRDPGLVDNPIAVTASDASADPSGETKYTLTMPTDGSDVEVTVNFQSRKLLTLDMVEDIDDFIFNWEGHEPELTIFYEDADGEVELEENTDYTVELSDTVNAGTAKATITGKGIYTTISDGATSIVKTFTINPMDLSNEGIVGELTATNFEYDGEEHMPALGGISYNNHDLVNEVDYWLAYPDSVNAGTGMETEEGGAKGPRCEITGKGNFTGKVIRYYTIAQADFNVEIADIPEQTATGEPIEPELTVTFKNTNNKIIPVAASDYTADYSNNVNPGTATVILSSTGNNFKTELTQTKTFIINGIEDYLSIKDGEAFLSKLRVTNGNTFDVKTHYQVVCPEDIPAADLTWKSDDETVASVNNSGLITAEGYGNAKITLAYAGGGKYAEDTYDFFVDAAPKTPTFSLPAGAYPTDQGAITITKEDVAGMAISYTWDDITGDNAAAWSNYADEGVAFQQGTLSARVGYTFTKGGITSTVYSDTVSVAYTYLINIATCTVTGNDNQTYTGSAHTPELTVTPAGGGTALTLNTDYTVSYKKGDAAVESMIDAGDYTIVITAKEGSLYEGSKEVAFTIIPKTIVADWVTLAQDTYDYTGEEVKAEVKVKDSDRNVDLTLNTDFTVAYSNNIAIGTATASVTGTGNYTGGPFVKSFEIINRVSGEQLDAAIAGNTYGTFYDNNNDTYLPEGYSAYIITGVSGTTATAQSITYIPKGMAVLVAKEASTGATAPGEGNMMIHLDAATDVTTMVGTIYGLYNGKLMRVGMGTIAAGKNVLQVTGGSGAPELSIEVNGETTGIDTVGCESVATDNEGWFTLDGRKLQQAPARKGLYIKNGKKVVVNNK